MATKKAVKKKAPAKAKAKTRPKAKPRRKAATGRPSVMTTETIRKLEEAFLMGCTDRESCLFADISMSTLYQYGQDNPAFSDRKETLKENPILLARGVQLKELMDGNSAIAQKVLDRKEGSKLAVTGKDGGPLSGVLAIPTSPMDWATIALAHQNALKLDDSE